MSFLDTNFLGKISIILISSIFYFCENSLINSTVNDFFIPYNLLLANDSKLNYNSKGLLYYGNNPFSGYLVKKNMYDQITEKKGFFKGQLEGISLGYYDMVIKNTKDFTIKGKKQVNISDGLNLGKRSLNIFLKKD